MSLYKKLVLKDLLFITYHHVNWKHNTRLYIICDELTENFLLPRLGYNQVVDEHWNLYMIEKRHVALIEVSSY